MCSVLQRMFPLPPRVMIMRHLSSPSPRPPMSRGHTSRHMRMSALSPPSPRPFAGGTLPSRCEAAGVGGRPRGSSTAANRGPMAPLLMTPPPHRPGTHNVAPLKPLGQCVPPGSATRRTDWDFMAHIPRAVPPPPLA